MTLDYLAHLRSDSARFGAVLANADPGLRVPSCPEWDAGDLLWHLAEVQWFWATIVDQRLTDPEPSEEQKPERPGSYGGLLAFFEESSSFLQRVLAATDPGVAVWMWADEKNVGYIRRRMAHEALIHRLDAELTVGEPTPLDPALATDGVEEALTKFFGGVPDWGVLESSGRHLRLRTTDTGLDLTLALGRWTGTSPNTGTSYDEPAVEVTGTSVSEPDATLSGTAADLDAWLWGRGDEVPLEVQGDRTAFEQLEAVVRTGIE